MPKGSWGGARVGAGRKSTAAITKEEAERSGRTITKLFNAAAVKKEQAGSYLLYQYERSLGLGRGLSSEGSPTAHPRALRALCALRAPLVARLRRAGDPPGVALCQIHA